MCLRGQARYGTASRELSRATRFMKTNSHRIEFTVNEGFKSRVKLLSAKWRVKSNVAIQRAVDLALSRERTDEEKALLRAVAQRTEQIVELLFPS